MTRLMLGLAVAAGMLLVAEGLARLVLGRPPLCERVNAATQCSLEANAREAWIACTPPLERPRVFRLARDRGRRRLVVLGASSMVQPVGQGVPERLARHLPEVEVLNLAVDGLQVETAARMAEQLGPLAPDLVLIYLGHNAYSAEVFSGGIAAPGLWTLPLHQLLGAFWLHHALESLTQVRLRRGAGLRPTSTTLPTTDDTALRIRDDVNAHLGAMLTAAVRASPAPVVLSTLLRNPGAPPQGVLTQTPEECGQVLRAFGHGARIAPGLQRSVEEACGKDNAAWWWIEAHRLQDLGREAEARAAWARSLATDPVPLRAPLEADQVIREVASAEGATLVDLELAVGPFPPDAWFSDAIHFVEQGADAVALEVAPVVRARLARP